MSFRAGGQHFLHSREMWPAMRSMTHFRAPLGRYAGSALVLLWRIFQGSVISQFSRRKNVMFEDKLRIFKSTNFKHVARLVVYVRSSSRMVFLKLWCSD